MSSEVKSIKSSQVLQVRQLNSSQVNEVRAAIRAQKISLLKVMSTRPKDIIHSVGLREGLGEVAVLPQQAPQQVAKERPPEELVFHLYVKY